MKKTFFVTTAIDYINAPPHIGHALEKVQADVMARYHRLLGEDVFFLTGSDEHGTKVEQAAKRASLRPQEFCDQMVKKFHLLKEKLNLSFDYYIRTTNPQHTRAAQNLWKACQKDIYNAKYSGYYCVGCEAYLTHSDLIDGKCPNHGITPEIIKEENYFFRLSNYQKPLLKHFEENPNFVLPSTRYNEIYTLIKSGLEDISISRSTAKLRWGIPVPGDPKQVMYVWFDALTNYISAIGYSYDVKKFRKWWPANVHVIGKDITRFHAILWPAMLMSAGLPLPKTIFVHGFITVGGQKMSKTLGNVIDPIKLVEKYGVDSVRYYLMREIPPTEDGDFTYERFEERYNADLANDLGNLLHRSIPIYEKYCEGRIPYPNEDLSIDQALKKLIGSVEKNYLELMTSYDFKGALEEIWKIVRQANKYIDETAPWSLAKKNSRRLGTVLYNLAETIRIIAFLIWPFLPSAAETMLDQLGVTDSLKEKSLKETIPFGQIKPGSKLSKGKPIFPRIQNKAVRD